MLRLIGLLVALATLPSLALAQDGAASPVAPETSLIERGQQQYDDLLYAEALQTLSAALVRVGNSTDDQATIYRLLAFTYFFLTRNEEAAGAYRSLLAIRPEFEPSAEESPRAREFFAGVRQQWETDGRPGLPPPAPVTVTHRSPAQAERTRPVHLRAEVEDPGGRVSSLVLAYRQGTSAIFRRIDTAREGNAFTATIPGRDVRPPLVEYYFEALDATGLPLASRGDVAAPLRIAVPAPSNSIFSQWWFWVGAAVIVGGAVTVGVLLATGEQDQGTLVIETF